MATNRYVYSGAAGAGTGTNWANAFTTLALAIAGSVAGDDIWVAHDHAESTAAAITLTFPGTDASPNRVMCVSRAGSVPPVAADLVSAAGGTAGGTVTTTGNTSSITVGGFCSLISGLQFIAGATGTGSANLVQGSSSFARFSGCHFKLASSGTGSRINPAGASGFAIWEDCTIEFSATAQAMGYTGGAFIWRGRPGNTVIVGATLPTTLVSAGSVQAANWLLSGLDLSALGSGKTLIGANPAQIVRLVNCKLGASVTVNASVGSRRGVGADLIGCDSGGTVSRNERYRYQGTLTTETTTKRTGGASDGVTSYSWKVTTTAGASREDPFEAFSRAIWNGDTGVAKTATIHIATDNVTLTDAEIWLEVDYLASSATPVSTLITDAPATALTAGANQAASTETWASVPGTPVKQKLEVTFTPQMAGPIRYRVKVAKASTTVYIDPKIEIV